MVDSAELFQAIGHPVRIKILKVLEKQPASFASLKRQLGIHSSGNLDYHLKKLGKLVEVRKDGLYGLTDAGREALLSIEPVEAWTETEKLKLKTFKKTPKAALFLGLLEICMTALLVWFFWPTMQDPLANFWGFLFFGALLLIGLSSGFGILFRWTWSWTMVLIKSALIMTMTFFLLTYAWKPGLIVQPIYQGLYYIGFVAVDVAAVVVASTRSLKDFLGIRNREKLLRRAIFGSILCMSNGLLLVLLELCLPGEGLAGGTTVFIAIFDTSVLCGLLIIVGGILIMLGTTINGEGVLILLGIAISIIFGFFPPSSSLFSLQTANHTFDLIPKIKGLPLKLPIAGIVGSFPIVGGLLALSTWRRIRA
jgi:DNA-binding HxlR family transcriptional regulator